MRALALCVERLEERRLLSAFVTDLTRPALYAPGASAVTSAAAPTSPGAALAAADTSDDGQASITQPPNQSINATDPFTYQVLASGNPAPIFSLTVAPAGMTIDSDTGIISWTPGINQTGANTVKVRAVNSIGSSTKTFTLTVVWGVAPVIIQPGDGTATVGGSFSTQITASGAPDPTYALVSAPDGMSIDPASGVISWTPTSAQMGTQSVTVSAANFAGTSTSSFSVTVVPDTTAPGAPFLSVDTITATDSIPLSWSGATDDVGVAFYRLYSYTPAVYKGHSGRDGGYTLVSPAKFTLLVDNIPGTDYTVTGLTPNSSGRYAVAAVDAAGNQSPYSDVVTATTLLQPTFTWTTDGVTQDPPLSVVANHPLNFLIYAGGDPSPTLTVLSAPAGVVFTPGQITNSQLTYVTPNISWTPTADEVGVSTITIEAINGVGSYTYSIPVTVTPDTPQISLNINGAITYGSQQFASGQSNYVVNAIPAFGSAAEPQYAMTGTPFNFQVSAVSNTNPTTFALVSGPAGMTLDPNTGAGTWTPANNQAGNTSVVIFATNAAGTSTLELSFVTYFAGAPSTPAVNYYISSPTTGANPAPLNPTLSWTPPADSSGVADYLITVTQALTNTSTTIDTHSTATSFTLTGLSNMQYFATVTPLDALGNPGLTSGSADFYGAAMPGLGWTASTSSPTPGTPLTVQFQSSYAGAYTYSIASGPAGATIDPASGLLSWTPAGTGPVTIIVAANSNGWNTMDAVLTFNVAPSGAMNLSTPLPYVMPTHGPAPSISPAGVAAPSPGSASPPPDPAAPGDPSPVTPLAATVSGF